MLQYVKKARMRFALVNGERQEAQPGLSGECPGCGNPVHARCGEKNIWHWSHKSKHVCDPWWENKTEWHRAWQNQFPDEWQEFVCRADDGERHIADVKTDRGWVIEFQRSPLDPNERRSRDAFYQKLAWVVDGTKRKNDTKRSIEAFNKGKLIGGPQPIVRLRSDECVLFRDWAGSNAPVFFDYGNEYPLLWLISSKPDGTAYVVQVPRASFIEIHRGMTQTAIDFDQIVENFRKLVAQYELLLQAQASRRSSPPLQDFQRYLARRNRGRGRL